MTVLIIGAVVTFVLLGVMLYVIIDTLRLRREVAKLDLDTARIEHRNADIRLQHSQAEFRDYRHQHDAGHDLD